MQTITQNANSLTLILRLNADRIFSAIAVGGALMGGSWIGTMLLTVPAGF